MTSDNIRDGVPARQPFGLGILLGRFQPVHLGHCAMIDVGLRVCARVGVLIGSSEESMTEKNPFTYEERRDMLKAVYGDRITVAPIPDIGVGNTFAWGSYVIDTCIKTFGEAPEIFVTGTEERRSSWFIPSLGIYELCVPKALPVSASSVRKMLSEGSFEKWKRVTPPELHGSYEVQKKRIESVAGNSGTQSL
ncbi:MAG: adenylyltransferase/cytidyltransferase family protein [Clostridia bacterium]|nr:adenylyltransferase/cytidyltransferase family protein [Clostridia bacterium]